MELIYQTECNIPQCPGLYIDFQVILYLVSFESPVLKNFLFAVPWTLLWLYLTPCLCCSLYLQYALSFLDKFYSSFRAHLQYRLFPEVLPDTPGQSQSFSLVFPQQEVNIYLFIFLDFLFHPSLSLSSLKKRAVSSALGPQCSFRAWQAFKNKYLSTCYTQALFQVLGIEL